ncbi:hypothetical protein GCM10028790_05560 [Micromonospora taraxaci]
MGLGVRPQDPLAQTTGTAVDDEHQIVRVDPETSRVARVEDRPDPGQLDEVVATADRPETVEVTGRDVALDDRPGRVVGVERPIEVGEPCGQPLRYGPLELDGEHGDAAADVGPHQERVQHRRRHGRTDGGALARV